MTGIALTVSLLALLSVTTGMDPVRLVVIPDRLQFFKEKSATFYCQGGDKSSQWTVMRHSILENITSKCEAGWGRPHEHHSCRVSMTLPWDTGFYWCQSRAGDVVSDTRNFTVSGTLMILHLNSTTTPPSVGTDMTLSCIHRDKPFGGPVYFYKDNSMIARCPTTSTVTLRNISKAHEGFYRCGPAGRERSPFSWISVDDQHTEVTNDTNNTWLSNITRDASSLCEIYSLAAFGMDTTEIATTAKAYAATTPPQDNKGRSGSNRWAIPRGRGEPSSYDNLYAGLGAGVIVIILLCVSYLVFRMYTLTRTTVTRKNSLTPYTTRRIVPVSDPYTTRRIVSYAESNV